MLKGGSELLSFIGVVGWLGRSGGMEEVQYQPRSRLQALNGVQGYEHAAS